MRFEDEFLQGEITSGSRKREFLESQYPQNWIADDFDRRKQ